MSDIDGIALEVVKAIGNIDPDKLPGGRTQAIAQAQILVRDAIEKQLEQAEAEVQRVRELAEKIRDIAIDSPASNNMQLIYRLACKQAERAGGGHG